MSKQVKKNTKDIKNGLTFFLTHLFWDLYFIKNNINEPMPESKNTTLAWNNLAMDRTKAAISIILYNLENLFTNLSIRILSDKLL